MSWFSVKWRTLGWSTLFLATTSCGLLGPTTVAPARRDYAEAIRLSANRELLSNIVRLRFAAMPEMLDLTQVVTQYSVTAVGSAGATFQSGANEFPLSLQSTLEEKPHDHLHACRRRSLRDATTRSTSALPDLHAEQTRDGTQSSYSVPPSRA